MDSLIIDISNVFIQLLSEFGCDLSVTIDNKYDALKLCMAYGWSVILFLTFFVLLCNVVKSMFRAGGYR